MQFYKHIAILLIIYFQFFSAYSQAIELSLHKFSEKEGLSDNNIHSFYEDSRGYLWICTNEGLNRFDGFTFKKYYTNDNKNNSLPSNIVYQVIEYKTDYILVGTRNGMTKLNILTSAFEPLEDVMISTKSINYIFKEKDGNIILCYNDGIVFLDSNLINNQFLKTSVSISMVHRLRSGQLLAATSKGYYFIDREKKLLIPLNNSFKNPDFPQALMFSYYDSPNNLLYTSEWEKGLFIIDLNKKIVERHYYFPGCKNCLSTNFIYCAFTDSRRKIWLGTENGIFQLNKSHGKHIVINHRLGEADNSIHRMISKIYEDGSRNIWFATRVGMSRWNQKSQGIQQYKNEFIIKGKAADINDIIRGRDNNIYISTYGNGIFCLEEESKIIKNIGRDVMPFNWSVTNAGDSIIATGHDKKMYSYHPETKNVKPLEFLKSFYGKSNLLLFSFNHSSGDTWYSFNEGGGLVLYSKQEKKYFHFKNNDIPKPFAENYFSIAAEDENGNIWFAVNKSKNLVCWQYKTRQFITVDYKQAKGKRHNNFAAITDLIVNGKEIWIATSGAGILLYHIDSNYVSTFSINDGLVSDVVSALLMDNKKRLWASTAKGLSCRLPGQNFFSSFTTADGLPETNYNERSRFYDSFNDKMYLGAQNSLQVISPDDLLQNKGLNTKVHLDGIKVNGETINYNIKESRFFRYDQNNLQFNFSVVDLHSSSGINLFYRLTGADNDWLNAGDQRTASYINLPAGKYNLNLKVTKRGNNFSYNSIPFSFTIKQAWWKTEWFHYFLVGTGIMFLNLFVRSYYRRKLVKQKVVLEKKQAIEEERSRIASDMHDDLGAGLSTIRFLSEKVKRNTFSDEVKIDAEKIVISSNDLIQKMNEIIWTMNEKNDSLEDLIFYTRSYVVEYCEENNLDCITSIPEIVPNLFVSGEIRRNVFLTVKESLHNIVKHANAKKVSIDFNCDRDLMVIIRDDGIGLTDNKKDSGNGLRNMQKRIDSINGSFEIINGNGVSVIIKIPITV